MPRFTLVTLDYPPERGGVARYLGELVRASQGEIEVVVESHHATTGPGKTIKRALIRGTWPQWWPMVQACREAAARSSVILVSHALPVGTAAMIAKLSGGAPYVVLCHGLDVRLAGLSAWKRWLFTQICMRAQFVVANSQSTMDDIKRVVPQVHPMVLTPGVGAVQSGGRGEARTRLEIAEKEEIILCVARLIKRKGIDLLFEATEHLSGHDGARLVVVGNGEELSNLRQFAEHLKHQVTFVTDATDEVVADWYAASDIFCLPARETPSDVEGFGIVYLEAAAHGLPVVATKSGGVAEAVVDGETGLLVPQDQPQALAFAIQTLLDDPFFRERLGENGRARTQKDFRWEDRWQQLSKAVKIG